MLIDTIISSLSELSPQDIMTLKNHIDGRLQNPIQFTLFSLNHKGHTLMKNKYHVYNGKIYDWFTNKNVAIDTAKKYKSVVILEKRITKNSCSFKKIFDAKKTK